MDQIERSRESPHNLDITWDKHFLYNELLKYIWKIQNKRDDDVMAKSSRGAHKSEGENFKYSFHD